MKKWNEGIVRRDETEVRPSSTLFSCRLAPDATQRIFVDTEIGSDDVLRKTPNEFRMGLLKLLIPLPRGKANRVMKPFLTGYLVPFPELYHPFLQSRDSISEIRHALFCGKQCVGILPAIDKILGWNFVYLTFSVVCPPVLNEQFHNVFFTFLIYRVFSHRPSYNKGAKLAYFTFLQKVLPLPEFLRDEGTSDQLDIAFVERYRRITVEVFDQGFVHSS